MKKLIYILAACCIGLTACDDDIEIWDSATLDYSGTYVCQVQGEDGTVYSDYNGENKIDIYNTESNLPNELWITDHEKYLELTSKFFLNGDPLSFASKSLNYDDLTLNIATVKVPDTAPTALGQTEVVNIWGAKSALVEGKILPKGMTTNGGNVTDSIYMKVVVMYGDVTFKSQEVPEDYWAIPTVAEFEWIFDSSVHDTVTGDETYVYSGYRYTGFPEDAL